MDTNASIINTSLFHTTFIEIFLLEHPEFLDEFVKVHVSRERVGKWLELKRVPAVIAPHPPLSFDTVPQALTQPVSIPVNTVNFTPPVQSNSKNKPDISNKSVHKCEKCDKVFSCQSKLKRHAFTHNDEKQFTCEQCGNKFSTPSNLKAHIKIHTGDRRIMNCKECGKGFTHRSHLRVHMRIHTGDMPFQCDVCRMHFTLKHHLTVHKRVHNKEKPYKCDECELAFTQSCNLKKHKLLHSDSKPYKCSECDQRFRQTSNLTKHRQRHHQLKK